MDTLSLRLFVLAAEKLNISAAGRELGMAPAVASTRLAKLEHLLGSELLHRSTRKVSVSIEGQEFLPFALDILAQEVAALAALGRGRSEAKGTLRFAAPSSFAQLYIAPLLPEFLIRHPGINLDLRFSDMPFDPIEGSFDLALRNHALSDSSLKARKLADDVRVLCAAPSYLAEYGRPQRPADLAHHQLIDFQGLTPRTLTQLGHKTGLFPPPKVRCRLVVDDGLSQKLATLAGGGISANALWSVHQEIKDGRLERVLPDHDVEDQAALWLIYPQSNVLTAKVRAMIDFLVEKIGRRPAWTQV